MRTAGDVATRRPSYFGTRVADTILSVHCRDRPSAGGQPRSRAMEWEGREESSNVEDRRAFGTTAAAVGGGGALIVIVALLLGVNPAKLLDMFGGPQEQGPQVERKVDPQEERQARFTKVILRDTEEVW